MKSTFKYSFHDGICIVCKKRSPAPSPFGLEDGPVCNECWPNYRIVNFRTATCQNCGAAVAYHKEDSIPELCAECRAAKRICSDCKRAFFIRPGQTQDEGHCVTCRQRKRMDDFHESVPENYRDTKLDRLPDPSAFDLATSWASHKRRKPGLYLRGDTGGGKTRCLYWLAQMFVWSGCTVEVMKAAEFKNEVIRRTMPDGAGGFYEFRERLLTCRLLCFDEIDHLKWSERSESEFYDILDSRIHEGRLTVVAGNLPLSKAIKKFSPENQAPLNRRFKEFFSPIVFHPGAPKK